MIRRSTRTRLPFVIAAVVTAFALTACSEVFDDADLDAALEGAMIAKMRNGGEACTAANRLYVAESDRRRIR